MNKIYIDFDGTITNSVERIVDMYNADFRMYKDYKTVHWTEINSWNFTELKLASKDIINDYFNQYRFFQGLEFMENAKEYISMLSLNHEIIVVSLGNDENLTYKEEWLKKNLPCIDRFIGLNFREHSDKSSVDMSDGFLIEDNKEYLESSNAKFKIIYGDEYEWNSCWDGVRCYNWKEVFEYIKMNHKNRIAAREHTY